MGVLLRADLKRHLFWQLALCLFSTGPKKDSVTGKSFSEALILVSTNPQYDIRLFIELRVQYMKTTSLEMLCTQIGFCIEFLFFLCLVYF